MYRVVTTGHLARAADGRFIHDFPCDCTIVVAGVGGTGAYLAEYAAQRAYAARHRYANARRPGWACRIILIDPDTVERRNVVRQNFSLGDVGRRKVDALGERLLRHYAGTGLRVATAARRFERDDLNAIAREAPAAQLWLVGCLDNPAGRQTLHEAVAARHVAWGRDHAWPWPRTWSVDCGNDFARGQVLLGNATRLRELVGALDRARGTVAAPVPGWDEPLLLAAGEPGDGGDVGLPPDLDCATALELGHQSPAINAAMALAAADLFYAGLTGRFRARGGRLALDEHLSVAVPIRPSELAERCGLPEESLFAPTGCAGGAGDPRRSA